MQAKDKPLTLRSNLTFMNTTYSDTQAALLRFVQSWMEINTPLPGIEVDPDWPSDCYCIQDGRSVWQPTRQNSETDMFTRLEHALMLEVPSSVKAFYLSFWSESLLAQHARGDLFLIQVLNGEDIERLRENLIGHIFAQQKNKVPLSWFIGCTEPGGEQIISVDHHTGCVVLEKPGDRKREELSPNLASFLASLTPLKHQGYES